MMDSIEDEEANGRMRSHDSTSSLDTNMEKLFRGSQSQFLLTDPRDEDSPAPCALMTDPGAHDDVTDGNSRENLISKDKGLRYSEADFRSHRRSSFPHIHHPLGMHTSRSSKALQRGGSYKRRDKSDASLTVHKPYDPATLADVQELVPTQPLEVNSSTILEDIADNQMDQAEPVTACSSRSTVSNIVGSPKHVGFILGSESDSDSDHFHDDVSSPLLTKEPAPRATKEDSPIPTKQTNASLTSSHSVAAHQFQSQSADDPVRSEMFENIQDTPQSSQKAAKPMITVPSIEKAISKEDPPKVKFLVGEENVPSTEEIIAPSSEQHHQIPVSSSEHHHRHRKKDDDTEDKEKHARRFKPRERENGYSSRSSQHKRHHHRHKELDLTLRRTPGSEVQLESLDRIPTATDDLTGMDKSDADNVTSHRFADQAGIRRHKIERRTAMVSTIEIGHKDRKRYGLFKPKKKFDHSPHEAFVELDELYSGEGQEWEWREKARWIKFEEDVEEGAERWGKPHVASLSFHSLLELRKGLEIGVVLLDLEVTDFSSVANHVVENLILADQIDEDKRGLVLKALLLKHRHVSEKKAFIPRNFSYQNLRGLESRHNKSSMLIKNMSAGSFFSHEAPPTGESNHHEVGVKSSEVKVEIDPVNKTDAIHIKSKEHSDKSDLNIMRKIPKGAEATTVLVGAVDFLEQPVMAFVRLSEGQMMSNVTEVPLPVRFLFILLGPQKRNMDYHEIGRSISTLMSNTRFHDVAYRADDRQVLLSSINEFLDESIVLPPGDWDRNTLLPIMDMARKKSRLRQRKRKRLEKKAIEETEKEEDPLKRTRRCFGGMVRDIKRRYPFYLSDFKDAMNPQCLAAFIFIYFAALSPAITFGGLLSEKTTNLIGVSEMLVATCGCGIIFGLLSGQPLLIIGATGPILVFEESLFNFCESNEIEYLPFRVWIGLWVAVITTVIVAFDGSFLVRYFTRFTQEIFASLISLIFIYEVFKKLITIYQEHPLKPYYPLPSTTNTTSASLQAIVTPNVTGPLSGNGSLFNATDGAISAANMATQVNQPNTALLSTILMLGTFIIAHFLKQFRNSKFLGRSARRALGDFGIPIAIAIMAGIDILIQDTYTQKLDIPDGLSPTDPEKRGWFINPLGMNKPIPIYLIFAAIIPALLVVILVFMESQITGTIVNKKDRKLKKGSGYHLDMFIIGMMEGVLGLFGLPFVCAATVRSISHVSALTVMSRTHAPGEKPRVIEVKEQRLTGILVNLMVGVSVALGPVLREIPLAVLFGVFLYMGVASMNGIQMFERFELMFMPVKHHPTVGYVRRVKSYRMHIFTAIQLVFLGILWAVKSSPAALAFPFILIMLVPVRLKLLKYIFTKDELHELDREGEESAEKDDDDDDESEKDFYEQAHMPM